jgi:hypothetical protein
MAGGFGNHRKYESLNGNLRTGTGEAVASYVAWVRPPRTQRELFDEALAAAEGNRRIAFDKLYESMTAVRRFGRTARFDFLTMLGKLGLVELEAPSAYLRGATGPLRGARLLYGGSVTAPIAVTELESWLSELDGRLQVGMQALEDSLCNWQKSPRKYIQFRG